MVRAAQVACITFGGCPSSGHSETAPERAYELYNTANVPLPGPGTALKRIKTYPIGFGIAAGDARIENIAKAGHTNAPGANFGFYADDETALSAALNQIILESIKVEVCNGTDDDCDARIDEGSAKYCDLDGLRTTNEYAAGLVQPNLSVFPCPGGDCGPIPGTPGNTTCDAPEWATSCTAACDVSTANGATTGVCTAGTATHANLLCVSPGEICDQSDDDCDGRVDEGAAAIPVSDGCDLVDTDCDGLVDENCTNVCPVLNCNAGPNLCPESCNGVDDDCDGAVDDGIGSIPCGINLNECTSGLQICQGGVFGNVNPMTGMFQAGYCLGGVGPTTEICDNKDNDCDGVVDQIVRPCSPYGTTLECRAGEESCVGGVWQSTGRNEAGTQVQPANPSLCVGALGPSSEVCDGKNNDCDANTDESPVGMVIPGVGLVCHAPLPPGAIVPGSSTVQVSGGVSRCSPGVTVCSAAAISCSDPYEGIPETCNGLDDNCNGLIDEGTLANVGDDCFPGMPGPVPMVFGTCELGELACIGGALVCTDYVLPSPEICDGRDNDCDNTVDDTIPGVGVTCGNGTGECEPGQTVCHVVSTAGGCMVDASCASGQVCNASVCQTWDIECNDPSEASSEICDGRDNNCNGATDEGVPGVGTACGSGTGQCSPGQQECVLDSGGNPADPADWSIVCVNPDEASRETCDGVDNDCDGETDE